MLKSMTAYGRASLQTDLGHFVLEIQSVNRKFLEVNVLLPKELSRFELDLKKWVSEKVARGQVTIKVSASFDSKVPIMVRPNLALAKQVKQAWSQIAEKLLIDKEFDLSLLAQTEGILLFEENIEDEGLYRDALKSLLEIALKNFLKMREQEGMTLQSDMVARLTLIKNEMQEIEKRTPYATAKYREKLVARLEEVLPGHLENEERILREIALFAEKIDITEEITRFYSHLTRVNELLTSKNESVGKTLEFILQELGREINTIGSKSSDIEVSNHTINIKSELEKIREQIQNIE